MMRGTALVLGLCAALAGAAGAQPVAPAPPMVVVHGEGEVRAVPDVAFVTIGAESRAQTPKDAQAASAKAMTAVQDRIVVAGVPKAAIRTLSYDLQPQFDYTNGKQVPRGYLARNVIEARLDDLAKVGEVLELAVAAGGTSVQGVRFDVKARAALEREALTRAVADARARAEAAAKGAGATVDAVLRIEEAGRGGGPEPVMMRMAAAPMAGDAAPPVAPGETIIRATVTLTARLK